MATASPRRSTTTAISIAEAWKKHRDHCRVVRFWGGEEEDIGHLVHRPGGSWGFHYDVAGEEGDEAGFKLSNHVLQSR